METYPVSIFGGNWGPSGQGVAQAHGCQALWGTQSHQAAGGGAVQRRLQTRGAAGHVPTSQ